MSFSSPWTLWESTRERGRESACTRNRRVRKREGFVVLWGVGVGKRFLSWITSHSASQWSDGPKTAGPMISIDFSVLLTVCVRVCLCAGACEGLRRMKFLMFEFVERERDKWESRREERVWMIFFPLTSSGVRLCNWLVFLHLRVRVHCTRVCSSLHYNVCISLVLVTSVAG